jgi:hypothetical protein
VQARPDRPVRNTAAGILRYVRCRARDRPPREWSTFRVRTGGRPSTQGSQLEMPASPGAAATMQRKDRFPERGRYSNHTVRFTQKRRDADRPIDAQHVLKERPTGKLNCTAVAERAPRRSKSRWQYSIAPSVLACSALFYVECRLWEAQYACLSIEDTGKAALADCPFKPRQLTGPNGSTRRIALLDA